MKERLRRFGKVLAYGAFFFLMLSIFVAVTFPYDAVRAKIVGAFNAQQKPGAAQQELQIGDLSGYWVTGVEASDVKLLSASTDGSAPAEIVIDEARARLQLLPLLIFRKVVKLELEMLGGTAVGSMTESGDTRSIELEFDGVDLGALGPVKQAIGLPLQGQLYGTLALELPGKRASKANGTIALELRELSVGDGKAKLKIPGMGGEGFTVQKLNVGTLVVEGEAKDGLLKLTKVSSNGPELIVDGEGTVKLNELANESIVNVTLGLKIADSYKNKSEANKGLFAMLDFAPDAKAAKRPDGTFGIRLAGPLGRLKPAAAGGAGGTAAGAGGVPTPSTFKGANKGSLRGFPGLKPPGGSTGGDEP